MEFSRIITPLARLLSLCLIPFFLSAQQSETFVISGTIRGYSNSKLLLNRLEGHKEYKVSETTTDDQGKFSFSLPSGSRQGMYRLRTDNKNNREFIVLLVDGRGITIHSRVEYFADSTTFSGSALNLAFHEYKNLKADIENRLSLLEHLLSVYPTDDRFYPLIIKEIDQLQDDLALGSIRIANSFKNTILDAYICSDQSPKLDTRLSFDERQQFAIDHYLDNIDFSDTLLLNTDIFPGKSFTYLMFFRNSKLDRDQQANEFIRGIDLLMPHAMVEPKVFNYLLEYIISGFEQIGFEKVLDHIATHYEAQELCVSDQETSELKRRIEGYKRLAAGKKAPPFLAKDLDGKEVNLATLKADRVLLVFHASWCPHCAAMLPKIKELALRANGKVKGNKVALAVIAVSIDTDDKVFEQYVSEKQLRDKAIARFWFNLCDYKGWDGDIPKAYYLYATPTLLLLDPANTILAKPSTLEELTKLLSDFL